MSIALDATRDAQSAAVFAPSATTAHAQTSVGPSATPFDSLSVLAHPTDDAPHSIAIGASRGAPKRHSPHGIVRDVITYLCVALGIDARPPQPLRCSPKRPPDHLALATDGAHALGPSLCRQCCPRDVGKKCLVLDLDETLVHSSFRPTAYPHTVVPVELDGVRYRVYMCARPGAHAFLVHMAQYFELVVFTASVSAYADPLLDALDTDRVIRFRCYREHCVQHRGTYVKDLAALRRDMSQTVIVDNAPVSYALHPQNAIACSSFIDDPEDSELPSIARFLTSIRSVRDVREHLHLWEATY